MKGEEDTFLKRYFRVIAKPIILIMLFFIILISIHSFFGDILYGAVLNPSLPADVKQRELDRLRSLQSWLTNLFQGNFGYSIKLDRGQPILDAMYPRLLTTLFLIGFNVAVSVITGVVLVFVFSLWKKRGFKPMTFATSLNGYFFGLAALMGFTILVLCIYLREVLGIPIETVFFPPFRYPWPSLFPVLSALFIFPLILTVIIVALIRNLLVIGCCGLSASENNYKSLLLPITTIDFGFAVSVAFILEPIFGINGLCTWFISSLYPDVADYNVSVAAFIALIAIVISFEIASTPFKILKHRLGLNEASSERNSKTTTETENHPSRNIWKFSKRKLFWAGIAIITSFLLVAALAPWITGGIDPNRYGLAESYAVPEWLGLYNPAYQNLPPTLNYSLDWNWAALPQNVTAEKTDDTWIIHYNRTDKLKVVVSANTTFDYPYIPPYRFYCIFSWGAFPAEDQYGNSLARYSIEINWTTPAGKVYPLWDQHWWAYKGSPCYLPNLNPPPDVWKDWTNPPEWWGPNRNYYPGDSDYQNFFEHRQYPWSVPQYDRMGYDIYGKYYNGTIPLWDSTRDIDSVRYPSESIYPTMRMGYVQWYPRYMTRDLFSPNGTFTMQLYVTIMPTQSDASCEIRITTMNLQVPGLSWGLLGTDYIGHDVWARIAYAAGATLTVASVTAALALLIGFTLWLVTGYFKGWFGDLAMAFLDAIVSLPVLLFILPIVTFMGRNWLFISLVTIPFLSALVAKAFKQKYAASPFNQKWRESNKENQYISLTKTMFASFFLIMASVILLFFTVDFLGFGDPSLPTWGREYAIIQEIGGVYVPGQGFLWWWFVPPGLFTALLILGFMLLGSSLDEEHSKVANSLNN